MLSVYCTSIQLYENTMEGAVASTPATALRSVETHLHPDYVEGKKLGAEISELCAYIYAATYRLLVLIREFDEKELWAEPGLCSCAH